MASDIHTWDLEVDRIGVGKRLAALEQAVGMSPADLATLLGVPLARYEDWRAGRERLPTEAALGLKRNFGCALDWLFLGDGAHNDPDFQARISASNSA